MGQGQGKVDEHPEDQAGAECGAGAEQSDDPAGSQASDDGSDGSGGEQHCVTDGAEAESLACDQDEDGEHRAQAEVGQSG